MNAGLPLGFGAGAAALLLSKKKPSRLRVRERPCPRLVAGSGNLAGFDYIEFATGGASLSDRLPMVIFFHSRSTDPQGLAHHIADIPARARVVMPYGRLGEQYRRWWEGRAKDEDQETLADDVARESRDMAEFVREAQRCMPTEGAPVVTGHSQGGMMAMAVAAAAQDAVKAAVPVSGWLPTKLWPPDIAPTYAIHGTNDKTMNYDRTKDFVERASGSGLPIQLESIEGHGHGLSGELKTVWLQTVNGLI
jgi:phospholipase/carboxylesterase